MATTLQLSVAFVRESVRYVLPWYQKEAQSLLGILERESSGGSPSSIDESVRPTLALLRQLTDNVSALAVLDGAMEVAVLAGVETVTVDMPTAALLRWNNDDIDDAWEKDVTDGIETVMELVEQRLQRLADATRDGAVFGEA